MIKTIVHMEKRTVMQMTKHKNFDWTVVVTCQGQPFYYPQKNLLLGIVALVYQYLKNHKYNTMNFSLRQEFKRGDVE